MVRDLIGEVVAAGVGATVTDIVRETIKAVATIAGELGATAQRLAEHLHLDRSTISRRLRIAADGGFIRNLETKRGLPGRWQIGGPLPDDQEVLPHRCTL